MVPHLHKPPQNKKKNLEKTLGTDISPNPSPSRNMNTKENQRSINDNHTFVGKVVCLLRCRRLWDNLAARGWPGVRPDGSPGLRGRFVLGGVTASRFCFLSCVYSSFLPSFYLSLVSVSVVCMGERWFMCATTRVDVMGQLCGVDSLHEPWRSDSGRWALRTSAFPRSRLPGPAAVLP